MSQKPKFSLVLGHIFPWYIRMSNIYRIHLTILVVVSFLEQGWVVGVSIRGVSIQQPKLAITKEAAQKANWLLKPHSQIVPSIAYLQIVRVSIKSYISITT